MRKKMLMMLLAGTMSISALVGCGKSEEKAVDEIADHVRDEAEADGVDIDKMIEEEKEQYEARLETETDEMERLNAAKVELGDYAEEKMAELVPLYNEYHDAEWEEDEAKMQEMQDKIKAEYETYRNEYNEIRDRLLEEYNLDTLPTAEHQATTRFYRLTSGRNLSSIIDY